MTARSPALVALFLLAFTICARADSLRADFAPLTLRPRTNAPAIFDIKLHRAGAGLLEGALEITLESGSEVLLRQRTQELALPAGAQSFRIITPPLPPQNAYLGTDAHLRFVTKNDAIELGVFPVSASSRAARNFVLAVCDTHAAGARDVALWQSLRLESFLPSGANTSNLIATAPAFLAPEDFPANPLAFFAFDLVLLDGEGFALLREKQLTALARWVEAGGSLCVLPGRGLKDEHLRFLNAFLSGKNPASFQMTDTGEFAPVGEPRLLRTGLGRVVVANRPTEEAFAKPEWQRAVAFLWKVRAAYMGVPAGELPWTVPARLVNANSIGEIEARDARNEIDGLLKTLLPAATRLISPRTLAFVLGGFLLVVGPLDWFVLGFLRRRRWTWVIFPLASAGFTWLVISEAGRALGRQDHRAALAVTDVGPGGRVLRESRFELLFTARNQGALTEFHNAFAVATRIGRQDSFRRGSSENSQPVSFSGQMPVSFTLRQQLWQWTPQFNCVTSLGAADAPASPFPWTEFDAVLSTGEPSFENLRKVSDRHPDLGCFLFHGDIAPFIANSPKGVPGGFAAICRVKNTGLGGVLTRTSPDAAGDFTDLPLLDPTDVHEWLLVISQLTPDGVHLYRRLFRTDD